MRRIKVALHWQIFIALFAAVIFGIIFLTKYELTGKSLKKLSDDLQSDFISHKLAPIANKSFKTSTDFESQAKNLLDDVEFSKHRALLIKCAYYNPVVSWVEWMGVVFLRGLKMIVIPLILLSIISGILSIGSGNNLRRLGLKAVIYYLSTSILALISGFLFVNIINPGKNYLIPLDDVARNLSVQHKSLKDIFIEIVPDNIFMSLINNELLSVIFVAILTGIFANQLEDKKRTILADLFESLFELCIKITMFIIKLAPLGVFGLVVKTIADQDNLSVLFSNLGAFMACVLSALIVHALVILPLILYLLFRINPVKHLNSMIPAILTAFSTASSAATLPLSMDNVKRNSGVSDKIANLTLPIGATVNMDGTAIYIAVVVMFIAQVSGVPMGIKEQVIVLLSSLLASIGTAAIPMGSLVIITIVLDLFGLPLEMIALVLPVDRILDMFRTSVNIWSDSCGAVVIAKTEGEKLKV